MSQVLRVWNTKSVDKYGSLFLYSLSTFLEISFTTAAASENPDTF